MTITIDYIHELKKATSEVLAVCEAINSETQTISEINTLLPQKGDHKLLLKTEKVFLSDLIYVFSKVKNLSEKAQF